MACSVVTHSLTSAGKRMKSGLRSSILPDLFHGSSVRADPPVSAILLRCVEVDEEHDDDEKYPHDP